MHCVIEAQFEMKTVQKYFHRWQGAFKYSTLQTCRCSINAPCLRLNVEEPGLLVWKTTYNRVEGSTSTSW